MLRKRVTESEYAIIVIQREMDDLAKRITFLAKRITALERPELVLKHTRRPRNFTAPRCARGGCRAYTNDPSGFCPAHRQTAAAPEPGTELGIDFANGRAE
jgi:hypothetical protein